MSSQARHWIGVGLLLVGGCAAGSTQVAAGQEDINRTVKFKVAPVYPDLARRMNIAGVVRIQITVASNGAVKKTKVVGGHPILAIAAMEAVQKWRYQPGSQETTGIVEFRFDPNSSGN